MMGEENCQRRRKGRKSKYCAWAHEEEPRKKTGTFNPPLLLHFQIVGDR
jgi:hypothetical protein